ncbi:hypothetical protein ATN84_07480 [Paramesorhizobium deserti]|uniref:Uncharacterized protein n=1 Tax=Paramesorhizobium deserti TaxID=1494590 RepID=A0A135HVK4_9HYPH|nr:hypothetical protein ATN84_07480 [Paramesorhizobium deserti]
MVFTRIIIIGPAVFLFPFAGSSFPSPVQPSHSPHIDLGHRADDNRNPDGETLHHHQTPAVPNIFVRAFEKDKEAWLARTAKLAVTSRSISTIL